MPCLVTRNFSHRNYTTLVDKIFGLLCCVIIAVMEQADTEAFDMKKMIADYMENGLLDNIIDMFKRDDSLYAYVGDLLTDERMRVRIGITALRRKFL